MSRKNKSFLQSLRSGNLNSIQHSDLLFYGFTLFYVDKTFVVLHRKLLSHSLGKCGTANGCCMQLQVFQHVSTHFICLNWIWFWHHQHVDALSAWLLYHPRYQNNNNKLRKQCCTQMDSDQTIKFRFVGAFFQFDFALFEMLKSQRQKPIEPTLTPWTQFFSQVNNFKSCHCSLITNERTSIELTAFFAWYFRILMLFSNPVSYLNA